MPEKVCPCPISPAVHAQEKQGQEPTHFAFLEMLCVAVLELHHFEFGCESPTLASSGL